MTVGATGSTGTVLLSNTNNYTGGTTINGSTLQFTTTAGMPATGAVAVNSGGNAGRPTRAARGEFTNATSGAGSIGGLLSGTGGQGAAVTFASGSILGIDTTNATGAALTYAGNITNPGLGLTKIGCRLTESYPARILTPAQLR